LDQSVISGFEILSRTPFLNRIGFVFLLTAVVLLTLAWTGLSGPDLLSAPLPLLSAPPQLKLILIDFQLIFKST
jgi:hypothetical protein